MREKTTLSSQNEKKWTKGKKIVGTALAATLLVTPAVSSAQETNVPEKNQDKKEIVSKTPVVAKADSTITWDEAVSRLNLEPGLEWKEISQEEIQEYLKNHKEDLIQNIEDEKLSKETAEILYKEIMGNKQVQEFIEEMVNRDDIRQAVLEGDEEYIKKEVSRGIRDKNRTSRLYGIMPLLLFFLSGILFGKVLKSINS